MQRTATLYLISHIHTDIGYTDYHDTAFRQGRIP